MKRTEFTGVRISNNDHAQGYLINLMNSFVDAGAEIQSGGDAEFSISLPSGNRLDFALQNYLDEDQQERYVMVVSSHASVFDAEEFMDVAKILLFSVFENDAIDIGANLLNDTALTSDMLHKDTRIEMEDLSEESRVEGLTYMYMWAENNPHSPAQIGELATDLSRLNVKTLSPYRSMAVSRIMENQPVDDDGYSM